MSRDRDGSGVRTLVRAGVLALLVFCGLCWWVNRNLGSHKGRPAALPESALSTPAALPAVAPPELSAAGRPSRQRGPTRAPTRIEPEAAAVSDEPKPEPTYDPFARHGGEEPPARVLVAVGDMQLGVLTNAKVHDEVRLFELLTRIGGELEKLGAGSGQTAAAQRQQLLEGYHKELGRYVQGEVELRGRDFVMGLEVGEVPPLEADWKPRPN